MSHDSVIRARDLTRIYRIFDQPKDLLMQTLWPRKRRHIEHVALGDLSLDIARRETVGVIGRNGAGKSTLLQIIAGVLPPTRGSVEVKGKVAGLLELGTGFDPEFTGRENVFLSAAILGLTRTETETRYDAIVSFADIGKHIDYPVKTYSSGMAARLGFAVAAHVDADILVIDEALTVGDVFFAQKCMRFLRKFMESGTVLFVSHDTGSVMNLCNRAIWLESGKLAMDGPAKDVCEAYLEAYATGEYSRVLERASRRQRHDDRADIGDQRDPAVGAPRRQEEAERAGIKNELRVFSFDPEGAAYGAGGARIKDVRIESPRGGDRQVIAGGEVVSLAITAEALEPIERPILGFYVKDRLGQYLFGDNTWFSHRGRDLRLEPGNAATAVFTFQLPLLPMGRYVVCAAVAAGDAFNHVQHHWLHEALAFEVHSSPINRGLVAIPMMNISVEIDRSGWDCRKAEQGS